MLLNVVDCIGKVIIFVVLIVIAMRKLLGIFVVCLLASCHKTEIGELEASDGRNAVEESDTTNVKPSFDINGWEGSVDAGFEFGSSN